MAIKPSTYNSLCDIYPEVTVDEILSQFVPPREFQAASFLSYQPDSKFASQENAVAVCTKFVSSKGKQTLARGKRESLSGLYLDGGFGVGKTHLLASIWHGFSGKKLFGSFLAYTGLIGAVGFADCVKLLSGYDLVCIDEFELDDPGDTMMMSRLLSELDSKGVKFAVTSNTPPNALGQGRFAASDFAREISAMAQKFEVISIDGEDYRHRNAAQHAQVLSESELALWLDQSRSGSALDNFQLLLSHLASIHPSKYLNLIKGFERLGLLNVVQLHDQVAALRFVALVDRMYEAQIRLRNTGTSLTEVFSDEMIGGAYRKKYLRAISRLGALCSA